MVYILSCNDTLGTCCSDVGIAGIVNIIKIIIEMIQVIAPIVLIVTAMIQLFKMMLNPDDPRGADRKTLYNKFIAAIIIFCLPLLANLIIVVTSKGVKGISDLEVIACLEKSNNKVDYSKGKYQSRDSSKKPVKVIREKTYDVASDYTVSGGSDGTISAASYLSSLTKMSNYVRNDKSHKWFYRWRGSAKTFDQAVKTSTTNVTCVVVPNWALRDIGVLKPNQMASQNENKGMQLVFSHGAREAIEKHAKIYHFNPPIKITAVKNKIGLKPGDIIYWKFGHTNVYAGTNSKGKMLFFDSGRGGDGGYKGGTFYFNSFGPVAKSYKQTVSDLIRLNK